MYAVFVVGVGVEGVDVVVIDGIVVVVGGIVLFVVVVGGIVLFSVGRKESKGLWKNVVKVGFESGAASVVRCGMQGERLRWWD